jgi:hypothetical protein
MSQPKSHKIKKSSRMSAAITPAFKSIKKPRSIKARFLIARFIHDERLAAASKYNAAQSAARAFML